MLKLHLVRAGNAPAGVLVGALRNDELGEAERDKG